MNNTIEALNKRLDELEISATVPGDQTPVATVKAISDEVESLREEVRTLNSQTRISAIAAEIQLLRDEVENSKQKRESEEMPSTNQE